MIHEKPVIAVLDSNIIYPVIIRDFLFWIAYYDLFIPKWSKTIFYVWKNVMIRKGINEIEAEKRTQKANLAFPYALVKNYNNLIKELELPDINDRHVLAVAIKAKADFIITKNLKDFPPDYLNTFNIQVLTPDDFIINLLNEKPDIILKAFKEMVINKKKPPKTEKKVIQSLKRNGLIKTVKELQELLKIGLK